MKKNVLPAIGQLMYQRFVDLISKKSGLNFRNQFQYMLINAIQERICQQSTRDYKVYFDFLCSDHREYQQLERSLTTGETYFFRYPQQFNFLQQQIIPELIMSPAVSSHQPISIWSAGCSTGEEPYSIAMLLDEKWNNQRNKFTILGTDLNPDSLEQARRGYFSSYSFRTDNLSFRDRYFIELQEGYLLTETIRNQIDFKELNLLHLFNSTLFQFQFDIIFCRNVMIYFDLKTALQIKNNLYQHLKEGGYMFLGHSETWQDKKPDEFVKSCGYSIYRKTKQIRSQTNKPPIFRSFPVTLNGKSDITSFRPTWKQTTDEDQSGVQLVEVLYREGINYYENKNFALAEIRFLTALDMFPKSENVLLALAHLYSDQGKMDKANQLCDRILDVNPLQADVYYLKGMICHAKQQHQQAEAHFRQCIYCDENHILGHFYLAIILDDQGLEDKADKEYALIFDLMNRQPPAEIEMPWESTFSMEQIKQQCMSKAKIAQNP